MNNKQIALVTPLLWLCSCLFAQSEAPGGAFALDVTVREADSRQTIVMAYCQLKPGGMIAVSDIDGRATIRNVPRGTYRLEVSYVGFETYARQVEIAGDVRLDVPLARTSLALHEVTVTARQNEGGTSTSSDIGRQAIDHLQAASLADVMQLIPGMEMGNTDLTGQSNLQLRTLVNDNTSAFGSSVVVDGMAMSNNGEVTQGGFSSTAFVGTDLRTIAADDIERVEVVRGVPSAEYGDLTSGLVIVHTKVGLTPLQAKAKVSPELQNYSLSKGLRVGGGVLNISGDYARAWGDPRQKTRSFNRLSFNAGYGFDVNDKWHNDVKARYNFSKDWSGNDPDVADDGTSSESRSNRLSLTVNGKVSVNRLFCRTLSYTVGGAFTVKDSRTTSFVSTSSGLLPILTARESGYHDIPWMTTSYLAMGRTESLPANVAAKVNNSFFVTAGKTTQGFKLGLDYTYDWNKGRGYYNDDDSRPYRPNSNGRPRAFSDVPGIHRLALYAEDRLDWDFAEHMRLRVTLGIRLSTMQPFAAEATWAASPRLNASMRLARWVELRGGYGVNSKTPGVDYIYPDKKYDDRVAANYMPQDDTAARLLNYHTQVYDVHRSRGLDNAKTKKAELGFDIKLPGGRTLSVIAYRDKTPDGFGNKTEFATYTYSTFDQDNGLVITPGQPTAIDFSNPARTYVVFMTTGAVGNTSSSENKGVEFDFDLGEVRPAHTHIYVSGAYSQTKTWSVDLETSPVSSALLPAAWSAQGLTPFRVVYSNGLDYSLYKKFLATMRLVTNIPALRLVASFTAQANIHYSSKGYVADKDPIGIIRTDLSPVAITDAMRGGFLDMTGAYHADRPADADVVAISALNVRVSDNRPSKTPAYWNLSARLTKEIGTVAGLSVYVNNALFYEPYRQGNNTRTLVQRNTGTFGFGAEISFKL